MHGEIVHYRPYFGIGADIARYAAPEGDIMPTQEAVKERLQEAFNALQARDQKHNDIVAEYVRTCDDWSSHTRGGVSNNHYTLDTHILNNDNSAVYIEVDYAFPATGGEPHSSTEKDSFIRNYMLSLVSTKVGEDPATQQDIIEFVVASSKSARIRHFTPEAVQHLQDQALEGTSLREILRGQYHIKTVVEEVQCATGDKIWTSSRASNWMDKEYIYHISPAGVLLRGEVRAESADDSIASAQTLVAHAAVEDATHGDEYRELFNRYRYDTDASEEERQKMAARMKEIVVANGYPDAFFGDAELVATLQINGLLGAPQKAKTLWNQNVLRALREGLQSDMYLYLRSVEARHAAAQTIQALQLAGKAATELAF